jgi:hypothetical protein
MKYIKLLSSFIKENWNVGKSEYLHSSDSDELKKYWSDTENVYIIPTENGTIPKIGDKVYIKKTSKDDNYLLDKIGKIIGYDDELLYRLYIVYFDDLGDEYPPQDNEFYSYQFFIIK